LLLESATFHWNVFSHFDFLLRTQGADGLWAEVRYTATGFPRVFYLRYHSYAKFFPLWALARFENLIDGRPIKFGM
jgi:squalene-hopene/tetraprenyl-beta-curcumene cyclase